MSTHYHGTTAERWTPHIGACVADTVELQAAGDLISYADSAIGCHSDTLTVRATTPRGAAAMRVLRRFRVVDIDDAADDDFDAAFEEAGSWLVVP